MNRFRATLSVLLWTLVVIVSLIFCSTSYELRQAIPESLRAPAGATGLIIPPVIILLLFCFGVGAWRAKNQLRAILFAVALVMVAWHAASYYFQQLFITIDSAKCDGAESELQYTGEALQLYRRDVSTGVYPTTLTQLVSDNAPGWAGPYLATIQPDPWSNQYAYTTDGNTYTIQSVHGRGSLWRDYTPGTIRCISGSDTPERIP